MCTISTLVPVRVLRSACLLALIVSTAVLTASPAANALLYVKNEKWTQERLTSFVKTINLTGYDIIKKTISPGIFPSSSTS